MSVLVIGMIAAGWLVLCALVVALCASAKEGDGFQSMPESLPEARITVTAGPPSLARR
jgi:hypothetical protein